MVNKRNVEVDFLQRVKITVGNLYVDCFGKTV